MVAAQQRYQNALFLNNAAVSFMARGDYRFAAEACKGALYLIKHVVQDANADTPTSIDEFEQTIVFKTTKRLATLPTNRCCIPLEVVSFDGSLPSNPGHCSGDWAAGTAIVINDTTCEDMDTSLHETTPAILMSNFALVHVCLSKTESKSDDSLIDGALRLLDISLATLGVHQRTMEVNEGNMFVAISILVNLCFTLQHHQDQSQQFHNQNLAAAFDELAVLQEVSTQLTLVTSTLAPVAGAA